MMVILHLMRDPYSIAIRFHFYFETVLFFSCQACPDSVGRQILYFTARMRVRKTTIPQAI